MKIPNPSPELLRACVQGDLAAIDAMLRAIESAVYNVALRMLGQCDDAADATQENLPKVVTHLGGFRGEAMFSTWVFQAARNHLLTASTRARQSPEPSLDALGERLQADLDVNAQHGGERSLTPKDKPATRQTALSCTQGMLMTLDRELTPSRAAPSPLPHRRDRTTPPSAPPTSHLAASRRWPVW